MNGQTYRDLQSSRWSEIHPDKCPCRGRGWLLSDFDTWHQCQLHGSGVPHPEDDHGPRVRTMSAIGLYREAYVRFSDIARMNGFTGNFRAACQAELPAGDVTPSAWVTAAEVVADAAVWVRADELAIEAGYSCSLEMRWAEEAAAERYERA